MIQQPSPVEVFDLLYILAARDGREEALFGSSADLAYPVAKQALIGDIYPSIYLEFPLKRKPCFDLLVGYGEMPSGLRFAPDGGFGYQPLFDWFSSLPTGHGASCGFSMDTGSGETQRPGVYLQYRNQPDLAAPFLDVIGESGRFSSYSAALLRLPKGMPASYIGLFPGREGTPLRIGGYMGRSLQTDAARTPGLLGKCFDRIGFYAYDGAMLERCGEIFSLAPSVDFQFNLFPDGALGDVFGLSMSFNRVSPRQAAEWMTTGCGRDMMLLLQRWGLADDRWKLLPGTAISKGIPVEGPRGEKKLLGLVVRFNYAKVKFKGGAPVSAKFYLRLHAGLL